MDAPKRFTTIKDMDRAGFDLRLWCYACQRDAVINGIVWMEFEDRGLPLDIEEARQHFRCSRCGARDCLIVPTKPRGPRPKDATGMAVTWFFANRAAARRR